MSKTPSTPSQETELVIAGQPSASLLAKLKKAGAQVTDEQIARSMSRAEENRALFQISAVEAGLLLLAKKQTVKHGQWTKWCAAFLAKNEAVLRFSSADTIRSLQTYTFVAQHFLADAEQGLTRDEGDMLLEITPDEVLTLETLPHERRVAVSNQIGHWVRGRSQRQMLADLRRADNAAAEEETTENPPKPARTIQGIADAHATDSVTPPIALKGEQLELWRDVAYPLQALDTLFNDDSVFLTTDRDFWKAVIMSLDARLATAKARLSHVA